MLHHDGKSSVLPDERGLLVVIVHARPSQSKAEENKTEQEQESGQESCPQLGQIIEGSLLILDSFV